MCAKVVRQLIRRWQERDQKKARLLVLALVLMTQPHIPEHCNLVKDELDRETDKFLTCYNTEYAGIFFGAWAPGPGRFCQSLVSVVADKAVHSAVKQQHCAGREPISETINFPTRSLDWQQCRMRTQLPNKRDATAAGPSLLVQNEPRCPNNKETA